MAAMHRSIKNSISLNTKITQVNGGEVSGGSVDCLPKQFVVAMKKLFDIMDDDRSGFVKLADIEKRWEDDGAKGLPKGLIDSLKKVTPVNGLLSFERFCAGLKICLLRNQTDDSGRHSTDGFNNNNNNINMNECILQRPPSLPLLDLDISLPKTQWNCVQIVRPNNATQMPAQRALSLPQLSPDSDSDLIIEAVPVIPGLGISKLGPPKPPRTGLNVNSNNNSNNSNNSNGNDRLDKAEIRNALQNWQMGVIMNDIDAKASRLNRGTADGTEQQQMGIYQKKPNIRKREPRRHTLQNGIDYNMLKRLKQFEQEKDVLIQGLNAVEKSRDWYLKQIATVQEKMKYLGRIGTLEHWSESHQERLDLQRARVLEVNRHLIALAESWERGGFPMHMNLALHHPGVPYSYSQDIVNRLKQQNRQLTEEVSQKSERITALEREKATLVRDVVQLQRNGQLIGIGADDVVF